jgi:hypothetical protein
MAEEWGILKYYVSYKLSACMRHGLAALAARQTRASLCRRYCALFYRIIFIAHFVIDNQCLSGKLILIFALFLRKNCALFAHVRKSESRVSS